MNSDFEPPPKTWSVLASVGGVVTAVIAIALLNFWSQHLSQTNPIQKPEISTSRTASPLNGGINAFLQQYGSVSGVYPC